MPSLREEITKTFLRWTRTAPKSHEETVIQPALREGQLFGVYQILERLGFGGMGYVYLALDARLNRRVALKFLPPDLAVDNVLLSRLHEEARTASSLNHPNILTIYEIGEAAGEHFIASEFVQGVTLRQAMDRGNIDSGTAIDIATQVASALLAAHAAGIVHRDLKPGNIMIRPDGYVKVIDFGIAKYLESASERAHGAPHKPSAARIDLTRAGAVVGTLTYMSPEQAAGADVDPRADLWSLGIVLYEMLARRRPFEGETDIEIVTAIQKSPLPPLPNVRSLPPGLAGVVERALAKDPAKRFQNAGEMLAQLHHIASASGLSSKIRPIVVAGGNERRTKLLIAGAAVCAFTLAAALWWWPLGGKEQVLGPDWFRVESVRQITFNGRTSLAAISPDGNYLAFVVGEAEGERALYLKQIESSAEEVKIPPRTITYEGLAFSPDSKYIFETEKDDTMVGKLYAVPILGSRPAVPLVVDIDGAVSFSPSGKQFAFVRYANSNTGRHSSTLLLRSMDGSEPRKLVTLENFTISRRLAWSPKGDQVATVLYSYLPGHSGEALLDLIDLNGRETRRVLPSWQLISLSGWMPDARVLIASAATRNQASTQVQLKQIDRKTGAVFDITKDLAGYSSPSLTRDGSQLTAVKQETRASLWISGSQNFASGQSVTAETEQYPTLAWSDETHLLVNSSRNRFPNVWLFDLNTQSRSDITDEPHVEHDAVPVPRSNSIVFSSNRGGQFHLWRFDPDANRYTQLTFGSTRDEMPSISPDGQWIVYSSWISSNPRLRRIRISGGPAEQVATYAAYNPQISPDGHSIVCKMQDLASLKWTIAVIPFDKPGPIRPIPGAQLPVRWSPEGKALTTVRADSHGVSNLWLIPLDGSAPRQITHFDADTISSFAWSPRGDRLACLRASQGADVALFTRQKRR